MRIPKDLTREHVLLAIADLDDGKRTRWAKSRKYNLFYNEKNYPPKAVLGLAICHQSQIDQYAFDFSGGDATNSVLRRLGFEVVAKGEGSDPQQSTDSNASPDA